MGQPRLSLVRHHRTPSHPPRQLRQRRRIDQAIRTYIFGWNKRAHPFAWTKAADQILKKANGEPTSNTDHQNMASLLAIVYHRKSM
jgi:hypothetical protein